MFTRRFDLAINKVLSPSEPDNVVLPGDTVSFDIKVYNQGNDQGGVGIPADNITIVDYVPVNLILVEENGWALANDSLATRLLEVGDELMAGGLVPDSCITVAIRFTMTDEIIVPTVNVAEIANATDTAGIEILDFDSDLDSMNMDINVNDSLSDNSFEDIDIDGDGIVDEDDSDFAEIISCLEVNCLASINVGLGPDCRLEITPAMLLADSRVAQARPDFYKVTLEYFDGPLISDNILRANSVGRRIKATITFVGPAGCPQGTCWTEISVNGEKRPYIEGTISKTVYCSDPFLLLTPGDKGYPTPTAFQSCSNTALTVEFAGEWIDVKDCVPGTQDTAKIIYREWAATSVDGIRVSAFDTVIVLRTPPMTMLNTYCTMVDTVYCGSASRVGPYMVMPDVCPDDGETACDTLYFINADGSAAEFASHCGLSVHVESLPFGSDGCQLTTKYRIEIKQSCYGTDAGGVCPIGATDIQIDGSIGSPLYAVCEFWMIDIDTLPPVVRCDLTQFGQVIEDTLIISTNVHDCNAALLVPPAFAKDACHDVKLVKVRVPDLATSVVMTRNNDSTWVARTPINIGYTEAPVQLIYEAYDSCHLIGYDTCYVRIKDQINPIAVSPKGLNISITSKKQWVDAENFNENSWDNCGVNLLLARRSDWYESCINLCDSVYLKYVTEHGDSIWCAYLEEDASKDPVEAFYAQQISWLANDGTACGELLTHAWQYDLCKYANELCYDHFDEDSFKEYYANQYGLDTADSSMKLGGGWSTQVPFDCMDACGPVQIELLVMDYWCNWGKTWTTVWVEDKSPVEVVQDVTEQVHISCSTYKGEGIDALVAAAEVGDQAALAGLDALFGGYEKAWIDPYGKYIDAKRGVGADEFNL